MPSAHLSPALPPSKLHTKSTSQAPDLTSSEMKDVVLCALVTKGIELPGAQVGILRFLPQIVLVFTGPFSLNNRHFEKGAHPEDQGK